MKTHIAEHRGVSIKARPVLDSSRSLFQVSRIRPEAVSPPTPEGKERCP
jgi:hypothetical protein